MAWIKRNLFFVIGGVIALALIAVGVFYFLAQYNAESAAAAKIAEDYDTLRTLSQDPNQPGTAHGTNDNVQAANDQEADLRKWITDSRSHFQAVAASGNLDNFPTHLDNTVLQLTRKASDDGVSLPKNYYFTFQAQKNMLAIPRNVLPQLASRLEEIKAICDILFDAKINALEYVRREAVGDADTNGPDYLPPDEKTTSTALADFTPYEVTFRCFSGELASAMGKLAASPHAFVIKSMDIEPELAAGPPMGGPPPGQFGNPQPGIPGRFQQLGGGGRFGPGPETPPSGSTMPHAPPPGSRPVTFLTENPLRVTLLIEVVKLKPGK